MQRLSGKNWCYTLNNWDDTDVVRLKSTPCKYHVIGNEVSDSGTPHLQGFIIFEKTKRFNAVRKLLGTRCHIEAMAGTSFQAAEYCRKDEDYWEQGDLPMDKAAIGKKEKKRWEEAWEHAKKGEVEEIDPDIRVRMYSTLKRIEKDYQTPVEDAPDVTGEWIWGVAGVGKSRLARQENPGAYTKAVNKWFDGYQGEEVVIIDDIDPSHNYIAYYLKIWSDRYAFIAEIKGGGVRIRPKKIIVTSQYPIEEVFQEEATREALNRRFKVRHLVDFNQ